MNLRIIRSAIVAIASATAFAALPAFAQETPPPWSSATTYNEGDLVRIGINYFRALNTSTDKNPTDYTGSWELYRLRANNMTNPAVYRITVGVDHSFTNIYNAWNYVANAVIDRGTTLQLYIDTSHGNFAENFSAALNLDHQSGSQIQIVGDNASNIAFNFSNSTGVAIDTGHAFGMLENVTINGGTNGSSNLGVSVDTAASLNMNGITVNGFGTGLSVTNGSRLRCGGLPGVTINGFSTGIYAVDSSYISCPGVYLYGINNGNNQYSATGIEAEQHSEIVATGAYVIYADQAFVSGDGSTLMARLSDAAMSSTYAYYAFDRGYIQASQGQGTNFYAASGGFIDGTNSTASSYTTDSGNGSYIIQ